MQKFKKILVERLEKEFPKKKIDFQVVGDDNDIRSQELIIKIGSKKHRINVYDLEMIYEEYKISHNVDYRELMLETVMKKISEIKLLNKPQKNDEKHN